MSTFFNLLKNTLNVQRASTKSTNKNIARNVYPIYNIYVKNHSYYYFILFERYICHGKTFYLFSPSDFHISHILSHNQYSNTQYLTWVQISINFIGFFSLEEMNKKLLRIDLNILCRFRWKYWDWICFCFCLRKNKSFMWKIELLSWNENKFNKNS